MDRVNHLFNQLTPSSNAGTTSSSTSSNNLTSKSPIPTLTASKTNANSNFSSSQNFSGLNYGTGRLTNRIALITGAGSGIGRATARLFAQQGAKLYLLDWNLPSVLETKQLILAHNQSNVDSSYVIADKCDVSNEDEVKRHFDKCVETFGDIDICFANAGVTGAPIFFTDVPSTDFNRVFDVNVKGVFNCFKYATLAFQRTNLLPAATSKTSNTSQTSNQNQPQEINIRPTDASLPLRSGKSLIATASVAALRSGAGDSVYSASKAAVVSLCQTIANQLTGTNVRCNAICPGLIETGMTKAVFDFADSKGPETRKKIGRINPMQRYGVAEEIASVALFLASDDSSYVTGQAIPVCGGLTSSLPVSRRVKGEVSV